MTWFSRAVHLLQQALVDSRHAGGQFASPALWKRAHADAQATEWEVVAVLQQAAEKMAEPPADRQLRADHAVKELMQRGWQWNAVGNIWIAPPQIPRHPGGGAAVATLQDMGWTYTVGRERWDHGKDFERQRRAEGVLVRWGCRYNEATGVWEDSKPLVRGDLADSMAALHLRDMGWTYDHTAGAWVCPKSKSLEAITLASDASLVLNNCGGGEAPGGGLPDWPEDATTFRERAMYQRGVADGRRVGALRDAGCAVVDARYKGAGMDVALVALQGALTADSPATAWALFPLDPVRSAAVKVLRHSGKLDGGKYPELDKALDDLSTAINPQ